MSLDKELYKKAFEQYRQWNEAELIDRIRNAGKLSPLEGWEQYVDLWEFCWKLSPQQSEGQRKLKLRDLKQYYERIKKFEKLRQKVGATTDIRPPGGH